MFSKFISDEYFNSPIFFLFILKEKLFFVSKVISWSLMKLKLFSNRLVSIFEFIEFLSVLISPLTNIVSSRANNDMWISSEKNFIFLKLKLAFVIKVLFLL